MKLQQLLENVDVISSIHDTDITDLCTEPSESKENSLFLVTGEGRHKNVPFTTNILQSAISNHTGYILWDADNWPKRDDVDNNNKDSYRYIDVRNYRKSCAQISSNFYGHPSKNLLMIGVTGTNGKTSTTLIIERILDFSKLHRPLLIGTLNTRCNNVEIQQSYTTPYCDTLQQLLRLVIDEYHVDSVVMEISSRGLEQQRVGCITFDVGIYTNLTQDHLSYHNSFEEYKQAKTILFSELTKSFSIINRDDKYAQHFIDNTNKSAKIITYGITQNHDTDIYANNIQLSVHGLHFDIHIPAKNITEHIHIPQLIGKTNIYNSLAAIACAHLALNIPLNICKDALLTIPPIPGRLEFITTPEDPITVIIDSAHTPDGFKEILSTIRDSIMNNKLICLFGCRGEMDHANRPLKGAFAHQLSDKIIITTDTSASEDPKKIVQDVLNGFSSTSNDDNVIIEIDRKEAIKKAIVSIMQDGDILIILGKRHNIDQMLERGMIDFDDRTIVRESIQQRIHQNIS